MVPAPSTAFAWDAWAASPPESVELSCFMPNSVYIPLEVKIDATLHDVKEDLWDLAAKYPLHGMLHDRGGYVFQFVNSLAVLEEVDDEYKRVRDLKPFFCLFRLVERHSDKAGEKLINTHITHLIGKDLNVFDSYKSSEVNDFRNEMRKFGEKKASERQKCRWEERLLHRYPLRLANDQTLPPTLEKKTTFVITTHFENTETRFSTSVECKFTPSMLLEIFLKKKANKMNTRMENPKDYILKVCGREEYLLDEYPIIQFLYVQETLSMKEIPRLVVLRKTCVINVDQNVPASLPNTDTNPRPPYSSSTLRKREKQLTSWDIDQPYSITVLAVIKLNVDNSRYVEVGVKAGIFHGGKSLCECRSTMERVAINGVVCWKQLLIFPIGVDNLPRCAKLCLVIYEKTKSSKGPKSRKLKESTKTSSSGTGSQNVNPLAWVNTTVFDYKSQLRSGALTLYMWTHAEDLQSDDLLHPLGTVVSSPNFETDPALTIEFVSYNNEHSVVYPNKLERCSRRREPAYPASSSSAVGYEGGEGHNEGEGPPDSLLDYGDARCMAERESFYEMHEQDRKEIWAHREEFREKAPRLLPKLLQCVEWGLRADVLAVDDILERWPELPAERALELLDYAYADTSVRAFAVRCLRRISDEDFSLYLLQLVQALKHESYFMCDLAMFLLERAFKNMKIGHYLFWHLKSEMEVPHVSVRFGLLLEAYLRGCQEHIPALRRQVDCLKKMKEINESVRACTNIDKARSMLRKMLTEPHCQEALCDIYNPLDPTFKCKTLKTQECSVMNSKMRPLWLVFENEDPHATSDVCIIVKKGDDLRQDMLTLQMLRFMDKLWKADGQDFKMTPYGCISMEQRLGMIEVVRNAETIANIQQNANNPPIYPSAFCKDLLLDWLREHNQTEEKLNKAIEDFTLSCAGYCVATYVLGVADRHSDNIMIKQSGQMFHIDFGHILGHFKEKWGIKRERAPFVMTHDFVNVINKGVNGKKGERLPFQVFQQYCEKAFMLLREHGQLFLSLFAMMISTGLPELNSEKDLDFLREALVLDRSKEEALSHFKAKLELAISKSWSTRLNWATHNIAKNK